jgi:hypothetical protein
LRVSVTIALLPAGSAPTYVRARVATPLMRWAKFRAVRSPASTARAFPSTTQSASPRAAAAPSAIFVVTFAEGSTRSNTRANTAPPQTTSAARATATARARVDASTVSAEVRSSPGRSSARARSMISSSWAVGSTPLP